MFKYQKQDCIDEGEISVDTIIDEKDREKDRPEGRVAKMNAPIIMAGNVLGSMKRRRF